MREVEKAYLRDYGNVATDDKQRFEDFIQKMRCYDRIKGAVATHAEKLKNMKWNTLTYTIYLIPKGTPRPRLGARGTFYVKGAADNKKIFKSIIKDEDIHLITTATKFYCDAYFPIPKSMNNMEKILAEMKLIRPQSKPDWDNVAKGYCDMLQGMLLYDDCLVIEGVSRKFYSLKPRIEIKICYAQDYDCEYNRNKMNRKAGKVR